MGREELLSQRLEVIDPNAPPPVWAALRNEAERAAMSEPALASLLNAVVISHENLGDALSPTDAWRPWGRRRRLKKELHRLMADPRPELPDHLQD